MELLLKNAISIFGFLLLTELYAILRRLAALVYAVLARRIVLARKNFVSTEDRFAELTGDFCFGPVYLAIF